MINRISLLAAGLTVLFLPLQPRAAAAERFTPLTVGGITLDREDFNEVLGSDTRPDTTAMRLFEEYALRLAAAAAAGYDLRLRDRSSESASSRLIDITIDPLKRGESHRRLSRHLSNSVDTVSVSVAAMLSVARLSVRATAV